MVVHERLRLAREARHEDLAAVAARSGVREHVLRALEDGRYGDLPSGLYGRTAVKAYAAAGADVAVTIEISASDGYASELVAAVYWCCVEALSAAPPRTLATVKVADAKGGLRFEVRSGDTYPEGALGRLRDRVEALGGELAVTEEKDGGSLIAATLPSPGAWSLSAR